MSDQTYNINKEFVSAASYIDQMDRRFVGLLSTYQRNKLRRMKEIAQRQIDRYQAESKTNHKKAKKPNQRLDIDNWQLNSQTNQAILNSRFKDENLFEEGEIKNVDQRFIRFKDRPTDVAEYLKSQSIDLTIVEDPAAGTLPASFKLMVSDSSKMPAVMERIRQSY